jgi:hypothetical protein
MSISKKAIQKKIQTVLGAVGEARLAGSMKLFRKSASTPATPATKVRRSRGDGSRQGEREGGSLRLRGRREGEERGRGWRREGGREGWRREGAEFLGR